MYAVSPANAIRIITGSGRNTNRPALTDLHITALVSIHSSMT